MNNKDNKPAGLSDDIWQQHLDWMAVNGEQARRNFAHHKQRVAEDEHRAASLRDLHSRVVGAANTPRSLFKT